VTLPFSLSDTPIAMKPRPNSRCEDDWIGSNGYNPNSRYIIGEQGTLVTSNRGHKACASQTLSVGSSADCPQDSQGKKDNKFSSETRASQFKREAPGGSQPRNSAVRAKTSFVHEAETLSSVGNSQEEFGRFRFAASPSNQARVPTLSLCKARTSTIQVN
jgi:hypothetical protein